MIVIKTDAFKEQASIDTGLLAYLLARGFEESSYRNDICPSYCLDHNFGERELRVFVDFDNLEDREHNPSRKYTVCLNDNGCQMDSYVSDNPEQVKSYIIDTLATSEPFIKGVE